MWWGRSPDSHLADVVIDGVSMSVGWLRPLLLGAELCHGHAHAVRIVRRLGPVGRHRLRMKQPVSTLAASTTPEPAQERHLLVFTLQCNMELGLGWEGL